MFIDIHSHAYRKRPPKFGFQTAEELIERYDKMKIDVAVLLPVVSPEVYFPQPVEDILEMCENHPDRFVPYCNIDPRSYWNSPFSPFDKILQHYKDLGCKGVGEIMPSMALNDPMVQNLIRCAAKVGMPIVYDGSAQKLGDFGIYDDPGLPMLEDTLLEYPELIVFGHGPVFWNEIGKLETVAQRGVYMSPYGKQFLNLPKGPIDEEGTVPKLFRRYSNLHGDLSDCTAYNAIARDPVYGARFLSEFEDRLYFGTDMCGKNMPVELDGLLLSWREQGKISETTFRKVAYENAEKLLGL